MRVCFLSPGSDDEAFYGPLSRWMQAAADQLGIELEVIHCQRDPRQVSAKGEALFNRPLLPEYLVLTNYRHLAVRLLPRAVAAGIKVFLINEGLLTADQAKLGSPREKLPLWLGQLLPDDFQAGRALADRLIEQARGRGLVDGEGRIHLCAITGDFSSSSVSRVTGLRAAVREHAEVVLDGVHPASWDQVRAGAAMTTQLVTQPATAVVWAASDLMALGAVESIRAAGRVPGEDLLVGGVDWAPFVPGTIAGGELTASAGGHFMDGAWALVMLHDHHHGRDFDAATVKSKFVVLTRDNLPRYAPLFEDAKRSQVDFARFSKAASPDAGCYDFTVEALMRA
jgi:ABC-type sugar transport system substrate-binding protein